VDGAPFWRGCQGDAMPFTGPLDADDSNAPAMRDSATAVSASSAAVGYCMWADIA